MHFFLLQSKLLLWIRCGYCYILLMIEFLFVFEDLMIVLIPTLFKFFHDVCGWIIG